MRVCSYVSMVAVMATVACADESVMAHWAFDDGVGREVADVSGNGNGGSCPSIVWTQGVLNSGGQLGGRVGFRAGDSRSLQAKEALTIQAWVKPWGLPFAEEPIVVRKEGAYALSFSPQQSLMMVLWLDGKKSVFTSNHTGWPNGRWQHVAATYDGAEVCLYVNGALDASWKATGAIGQSEADCFVGSMNEARAFTGTLDEVILHKRALSSREMAEVCWKGQYEMARRENRFTDFYEKVQKRSAEPVVPGTLWIDAEDFADYGGWWMDTQFVPEMGSPYLLAAGVGTPVEPAHTAVQLKKGGVYRLWVRSKNWLAQGHAPGQFSVEVNGQISETVFGTAEQRAWVWQDGGTFELKRGDVSLTLMDTTGWYGRCDALILTQDLDFVPKQEQRDYGAMRDALVGREPMEERGHYDVIIVGAGAAGCNAAIAAARGGAKVALIQNRPMVGGNNSAEMGVPISGGSSIGKGRETGLNEEIGRLHSFNRLSKWASAAGQVIEAEPNITLFLNTHVFDAEVDDQQRITAVKAFDMVEGHHSRFTGDYFADCTGDGWLGYYAGAEVMLGRESKETFGESLAKDVADTITMSGSLMQNSVLGYQAIDMGEPVSFEPEEWFYYLTNDDGLESRPRKEDRYRSGTWWTENHGRIDDLWDPEWARDDLILVSLSYYEWVKNRSSLAEKAKHYQLKYIPVTNAKRETRRLVGDHILVQQDLQQRRVFEDRVGYFVWKLDVHHPLGIFSDESPYDYENNISPAAIPFRIFYVKNVPNLFMAGRHVSVSAVALGSARVQGTTGMMGQVVGTAAALCVKERCLPRDVYESHMPVLQQQLLKDDLTIVHLRNEDPDDLALLATVSASSQASRLDGPENVINGLTRPLDENQEMWIGRVPNNMWISDPTAEMPQWVALDFGRAETVNAVYLTFDTNLKTKRYISWEQTLAERMPPECAKNYQVQVWDGTGWSSVATVENNYQRRRIHRFDSLKTSKIRILVTATNGDASARLYEVRAYNE